MNIASSTAVQASVSAASQSAPGASKEIAMLKKSLDQQSAGAAALIAALPEAPPLATSGNLGRNVNAFV